MRALLAVAAFAAASAARAAAPAAGPQERSPDYLPDARGMKIATISESGPASASIVVMTEGVAIKETGPKATVRT